MSDVVQIVAIVVSAALLLAVIDLVRRRRLREEYAFVWLVGAAALVVLSIWRNSLNIAANWLGVYYPPTVLVMLLIVMVFVASLCFSVIVSRQRQQIERLIEETAILSAELRDLRARGDLRSPVPPGDIVAGAARDRTEPSGQ